MLRLSAHAAGNVAGTKITSCPAALAPIRQAAESHRARIERQMDGFLQEDGLLVGPEARSSAPVRMVRDPDTLESEGVRGLYPVGEGAGFAGGIVSAAVDGLRAAESVVARHRAPSGGLAV